jgi:tetratricopeptide (TPR) repeat protein
LLRDAVSLDPNYALAKALAAVCIGVRGVQGISLSKGETDEGIRLAREALDGAWDDPSVLELAGWGLSELAHDHEAGLAALDRALLLNVNSAQALRLSGWVRLHSGDPRTATEQFSRAIRLSPLDPHITYVFCGLGMAHMMAGDYDEAVKFGKQAAREQPRNALAQRIIAASLALLGRTEEAHTAMRAVLAIAPNLTMAHVFLAYDDAEFVERYSRGLREAGLPE